MTDLRQAAIPSEWLRHGAVVPVTPETVRLLLDALRELLSNNEEAGWYDELNRGYAQDRA